MNPEQIKELLENLSFIAENLAQISDHLSDLVKKS